MVLFSCQRLLKVEYFNNSTGVVLLASGRHCHEVDEEHAAAGKKYRWDPRQHAIVEPLARSRATATVILRELKRQEAVLKRLKRAWHLPNPDAGWHHYLAWRLDW